MWVCALGGVGGDNGDAGGLLMFAFRQCLCLR